MFKNFLKLFSGNAVAQVIQFLGLLLLTNLYLPDSFGILGKIQSISAIIVILLTLQLQYVLPLSKSTKVADYYFRNIFSIAFFITLCSVAISIFFPIEYKLAVLLSFFLALNALVTNYLVFKASFGKMSVFFIFRSIIIVGFQIILSFNKSSTFDGLIAGALIGEITSSLILIYSVNLHHLLKIVLSLSRLKSIILSWKPYSFYGTIQEVLSVMVYSLPIIFYVDKFDENVAGQYSIAYKLIWAPTVLVSSSIAQVLTHKFARDNDYSFIKKTIWFNPKYLILVPIFLIGIIMIEKINYSFVQEKWQLAVKFLPYMFVNAIFFLFAIPYRVAMRVLKQNKIILIVEALTVLLITLIFVVGKQDVIAFTILITLVSILQNILLMVGYKFINNKK